jgi:DnaJ-class molecular chaperone
MINKKVIRVVCERCTARGRVCRDGAVMCSAKGDCGRKCPDCGGKGTLKYVLAKNKTA